MAIYSDMFEPVFKPTWLYIKQHDVTGLKRWHGDNCKSLG